MELSQINFCPFRPGAAGPIGGTARAEGRLGEAALDAVAQAPPLHVRDVGVSAAVCPAAARSGERVCCIFTVRNRSTAPITQVRFTAPTAEDALEETGVQVNGRTLSGASLRLGVVLPAVGPGACAVVILQGTVSPSAAGRTDCTAYADFTFGAARYTAASNPAALTIVPRALSLSKTADREVVTPEDPFVTYTLTVTNDGPGPVGGLVVTDPLEDPRLRCVPGTTQVDGDPVEQDPAAGVPLGRLEAGRSAQVRFQASVQL